MSKIRKSKTQDFLKSKPAAKLPSPEEVNQKLASVTGQPTTPKRKISGRIPLTTSITVENRAMLEVAGINNKVSVADIINNALEHYFSSILEVEDQEMVETFVQIFGRKIR